MSQQYREKLYHGSEAPYRAVENNNLYNTENSTGSNLLLHI